MARLASQQTTESARPSPAPTTITRPLPPRSFQRTNSNNSKLSTPATPHAAHPETFDRKTIPQPQPQSQQAVSTPRSRLNARLGETPSSPKKSIYTASAPPPSNTPPRDKSMQPVAAARPANRASRSHGPSTSSTTHRCQPPSASCVPLCVTLPCVPNPRVLASSKILEASSKPQEKKESARRHFTAIEESPTSLISRQSPRNNYASDHT